MSQIHPFDDEAICKYTDYKTTTALPAAASLSALPLPLLTKYKVKLLLRVFVIYEGEIYACVCSIC